MKTIEDVLIALDELTGGRVIKSLNDITRGEHPFVIMKSSNIPGKEIIETPGLVYGDMNKEVKKVAVAMTMTEGSIELAGATGVDAIVAHHPIAEAANSGGVILKNYLDLYNVAAFELHEAFHGLHPGIPFLHGHQVYRTEVSYGGVHGNILYAGKVLPEVKTLGDILTRLDNFMGLRDEEELLHTEKEIRNSSSLSETSIVTRGRIVHGEETSPVNNIVHIFPHTGFSPEHLRQAIQEHPEADTVLASISRVYDGHPLIETAKELGLNFIIGNCHVLEILENGLPLAYALDRLLPDVEVVVFRERVTSISLNEMGSTQLKKYAEEMAEGYLLKKKVVQTV
ncbi:MULTISPECIES: Nif3-like dinuclear metal center hexameric protein [Bacillales]|uniref:GTP cyclohydrolase 1 type 2 homolog n=1 Tax=Cytobacillus oceanisediminis 2691 TaxID=1196031 RepID=A0A160MDQ5_9BACI|nr:MULTISPECIES: Nif3-like dinuclear metal center hexameric protein [Bacillales]AND40618.1 NGG1p interacting factor NIF3 [Cytobacillus oceanisediminis 2691]MCM3243140.1 Nif3-like dinuclear metal center hexameric protein [Cytobacillus oceanisediminis]MCM3401091.1 Nif3-like dinuclear metal center hexameric protein [Cytobacillus oceanisediminis]MDK7665383.1 Nif3-like dinuclear metal center hexameric protein [Cytobacillus oceanisediminis]OMF60002.1 NGG1p interacting factor NIF3 [Paenibacillus sp. 